VDKVIFVGSVEVGKKVQEACIPRLTPLVLELGGKDAFVIWYLYLCVYVCVRVCVCVCVCLELGGKDAFVIWYISLKPGLGGYFFYFF
jgi:hypothetical protein